MEKYEALDALNGHPLRVERCRHNLTQKELAEAVQVGKTTIWRAEKDYPTSAASRQRICAYFGRTSEELGLNPKEKTKPTASVQQNVSSSPSSMPSFVQIKQKADFDVLYEHVEEDIPEQRIGAWLALESCTIASLFDAGWTLDSILDSLRIILQSVEGMPGATQRKLLQLGGMAVTNNIVLPVSERVSQEEQTRFTQTIGASIIHAWKLFHTTSSAQLLTIGQALLTLIRQNGSHLLPSVRPALYSGVYRLVGAALHFHGYYEKAYKTHEQAYIVALEGADIWNMVQCRIWQANGLMEQKRYSEAMQINEAALRLISNQDNAETNRLKAKILASNAEGAAFLGESKLALDKLSASKNLLEQLPQALHEEFDYLSWHQSAGTCALILGHHTDAIRELQHVTSKLPTTLVLRTVTALMPLAIAYARMRERDTCLEITTKAVQYSKELNALNINQQLSYYIREEIQKAFCDDIQIRALAIG